MRNAFFVCFSLCLTTTFLLSQSNPVPFVNQPLVPMSVAPGTPGLMLTVYGAGFVPTSAVTWNGTPLSTTFVSFRQLQAEVPGSDLASATTASVAVASPAPGGGASNPVFFTITNPTSSLAFTTSTIPMGTDFGVSEVVVADFNNDGMPDLAVLNSRQPEPTCYSKNGLGTVSILLGSGDGTFFNKSTLCVFNSLAPTMGSQIVVGDFNRDGIPDVVGSVNLFPTAWQPVFYFGNGDGTFSSPSNFECYSTPPDTIEEPMVAGDFGGTGNLGLAYAVLTESGEVLVGGCGSVASLSQGEFTLPLTGDFNDDGKLDLVTDNGNVLLGNGPGFTSLAPQTLVGGSSITLDFNRDGILDLVVGDLILLGNGDGTFTQGPTLPCGPNAMADFNGDGILDLVCGSSILLGNGDGTFRTGWVQAMGSYGGVAIGDFNGDGRLDLAITNPDNNSVSILLQTPVRPGATVTIASSQNPILINQPVTYTAVAWGIPATPTGSVTFKRGATVLGTVPLADGQATFTTTFTSTGTFSIVATYSGDKNYRAKSSKAVKQTVETQGPYGIVAPTTLDFGQEVVGQTSPPHLVSLKNIGNSELTVSNISVSEDFVITINHCSKGVQPATHCNVSVTFTPQSSGTTTGSLTFTDNASNSPQTISLTGMGTN